MTIEQMCCDLADDLRFQLYDKNMDWDCGIIVNNLWTTRQNDWQTPKNMIIYRYKI